MTSESNNTLEELAQERLFLLYDLCDTKEELQEHIRIFLNIDLPSHTVDPDSTSNPMDFVWEIYECMLTGKGRTRHVVAAARNTTKTLSACIIRFYSLIHFRRSGTHLAATLDQSQSAVKYLDKFLDIPGVKEYVTISNTRNKKLENLPVNRFTKNSSCEMRVAVATKKGVNSARGSFNCRDETDLLPPEIIAESSYISDPTQDEYRYAPIEMDLSSRKSNDGPMQDKIDEAEGKNPPDDLKLHKWNVVDWMQRCPTHVHKPELGKFHAFVNSETLKPTWGLEEYESMGVTEKSLQIPAMAYEGCKTCPVFPVCRGKTADQPGTSKMLRDIPFVSSVMKAVKDPDSIIAQMVNARPGSSSKVFKMFKRRLHFLDYNKMYKFITGYDPHYNITSTEEIYNILNQNNWVIHYGVDWGFSPASATCIVGAYHRRLDKACVIHVESTQEMANKDWANYIGKNVWNRFPGEFLCPDMADPASPSYFRSLNIPCRDEKPARIETGVSQLRSLLYDVTTHQPRFAILDDGEYGQNLFLCEAFEKWTHLKTAMGFNFDKFEDNDYCDFLDPTRYLFDPFIRETTIGFSTHQSTSPHGLIHPQMTEEDKQKVRDQAALQNQMQNHFMQQYQVDIAKKVESDPSKKSKQGAIKFRF